MTKRDDIVIEITPQVLLKAYACGIFPMAEAADDPGALLDRAAATRHAATRGSTFQALAAHRPAGHFRGPRRHRFRRRHRRCGSERAGRDTTWINDKIRKLYGDLYDLGHCHTVECWRDGTAGRRPLRRRPRKAPSSAKACFPTRPTPAKWHSCIWLARLIAGRFTLLDCQFVTEHLRQFGTIEMDRKRISSPPRARADQARGLQRPPEVDQWRTGAGGNQ